MNADGDYCCTPDSGDCCGPGSWCCARAGKHEHDEARAALLAEWEADPDGQAAVAAIFERKAADEARQLQAVETAMAYTTWEGSCKDPYLTPGGDFRECRRPNHHPGAHASGHSDNGTLIFWNRDRL